MVTAWKIAPGKNAEDWTASKELGCICLGWTELKNFRRFKSEAEVLQVLKQVYAEKKGNREGAARSIRQFVDKIQPPDLVVANDGRGSVAGIGVIDSEYLPPNSPKNLIRNDPRVWRKHSRRVNWIIDQPVDLQETFFFGIDTVTKLSREKLFQIRKAYLKEYPKRKNTLEELFDERSRLDDPGYSLLPTEENTSAKFMEGALRTVAVNAYERNPKARIKCVEFYGPQCTVCEFDFSVVYGEIGEGFIHVHHLKDIASIRGEYEVDPIIDLRPVCPNCHAMLHVNPGRSIEKLRAIIEKQRGP